MNISYCLIKPSHFLPVGIHEIGKDHKLICCSRASLSPRISPKIETSAGLNCGKNPQRVRSGAEDLACCSLGHHSLSSTEAILPEHTRSNGTYENCTGYVPSDHSHASTAPSFSKCYGSRDTKGFCAMQKNATVNFSVRTVEKWLNTEKGWYKKMTLITISICGSTEDVLHCNPVLGSHMSKCVWGGKYSFE